MAIVFTPPATAPAVAQHHTVAAAGNAAITQQPIHALMATLSGNAEYERILLKAAAGAGKSFALQRMVETALTHDRCTRVGITAFANKQLYPPARQLGETLGRDRVCLHVSADRADQIDEALAAIKRSRRIVLTVNQFFTAGQVYVGKVAPKAIQASAQGFIALITFGLGQGAGSILSGKIQEQWTVAGTTDWSQFWLVPAVIALVVGVLFALLFKVKPAEESAEKA